MNKTVICADDMQRNFVLAGVIGSFVATLALMVLAFLPRPFSSVDHFLILSSTAQLTVEQLTAYAKYLENNLTIDSIYLFGHIAMWFGYAALISTRSRGMGCLIAVLGVLSGGLDFIENEMRWTALKSLLNGMPLPLPYLSNWHTIFGLSFWVLFLCALIAGIAVFQSSRLGKGVMILAVVGVFAGSLVYKFGFLPAFLWLIVWHVLSGVLLWSRRQYALKGEEV